MTQKRKTWAIYFAYVVRGIGDNLSILNE